MTLAFESDGPVLTIRDPIERRQYTLTGDRDLNPTSISTADFVFPVDDAVRVHTNTIELPNVVATYVRDATGEMVAEAEHFAQQELPAGEYRIELCAPVKLYVRVEGSLAIQADAATMTFSFDGDQAVQIGARSHHEQPAARITTTDDPVDVMQAVSMLGSALKTTTPERSYPTLRGHPPTIDRGAELAIPPELERPDTGIKIEVPPELKYVYVVAPLAYYLGAEVVPGDDPKLTTAEGYSHALDSHRGFEREVERVLKQTFFLDCVTRTEGLYTVDLHERRAIEDEVDLDFAALYDHPIARQLEAYLTVPYAVVREHVPEWKLTTHVAPDPENVEMLPFLVNDLAVVRTPNATPARAPKPELEAIDDFTRSATDASAIAPALVEPEQTDSLEQAWVGEDAPLGASKATTAAFKNKLERGAVDGDIEITVVCNDPKMADEGTVAEDVYGSREELPFDVALRSRLTTAELQAVLESNVDFLHYVGHIDDDGFECTDGRLDVNEVPEIGVDAFLLNACTSYQQGMALIQSGAIGGVVTVNDVVDSAAVEVGKAMAKLLNRGFPLRAALNIAGDESLIGDFYLVVGSGNVTITQSESGVPMIYQVTSTQAEYEVTLLSYPVENRGMGSMVAPNVGGSQIHNLVAGAPRPIRVSRNELLRFFGLETAPVVFDGDFTWSDEISL